MQTLPDSSGAVSPLRAAASGSAIISALARLGRSVGPIVRIVGAPFRAIRRRMQAFDEAVERAMASRRVDDAARDARVREVLAESRIVRTIDWLFTLPAAAWPSSGVAKRVTPVVREFRALERAQQIRLAGWLLLVGLAARVVSFHLIGERAGWVSWLVWGVVALVAMLMMAWHRQIAAAWLERQDRRGGRNST